MLSDEMREELVQGLTDIFENNISMRSEERRVGKECL